MIIWINGAWGAGKTTTAIELHNRVENSFIFDPEETGFLINKSFPKELHQPDFQMFKEWREINVTLLKKLATSYSGTIIIPMTIINPQYVLEIIEELRMQDILVTHFILETNQETLNKRLDKRFEGKDSWVRQRINPAISSLKELENVSRIQTDNLKVEEVVKIIAQETNLELKPDHRSEQKKKIDRTLINMKEKIN